MIRPCLLAAAITIPILVSAADFSNVDVRLGSSGVVPGTVLDCHSVQLNWLSERSPKTFAWMQSNRIIEKSAISQTLGYSSKVTSKLYGNRTFLFGCWVATKLISEQINGKEQVYVRATYQLNSLIKNSPLMMLPMCKKRDIGMTYSPPDYKLLDELAAEECVTDTWNIRLPSLAAMENESATFSVRKGVGGKGYVLNVGW